MEDALAKEAIKKGFPKGSDQYNAYVYGTMQKGGFLKNITKKAKSSKKGF